ncbi:hypothetical protein LTR94_033175, partial [Friedmanniomyces endolithicus]
MPEAAAITDLGRALANCVGQGDMEAARFTSIALPSRATGDRQMAPKALAPPVWPVDELVDGLMADGLTMTAMAPKISRNLLRRPGCGQAVGDIGGEFGLAGDLAATHTTAARHALRDGRKIAAKQRLIIEMPVAFELAID